MGSEKYIWRIFSVREWWNVSVGSRRCFCFLWPVQVFGSPTIDAIVAGWLNVVGLSLSLCMCVCADSRISVSQELRGCRSVFDEERSEWPRQNPCNISLDGITRSSHAAESHDATAWARHSARLPAQDQLAPGQPRQFHHANGQVDHTTHSFVLRFTVRLKHDNDHHHYFICQTQ